VEKRGLVRALLNGLTRDARVPDQFTRRELSRDEIDARSTFYHSRRQAVYMITVDEEHGRAQFYMV
jgi:hypothetical protein